MFLRIEVGYNESRPHLKPDAVFLRFKIEVGYNCQFVIASTNSNFFDFKIEVGCNVCCGIFTGL